MAARSTLPESDGREEVSAPFSKRLSRSGAERLAILADAVVLKEGLGFCSEGVTVKDIYLGSAAEKDRRDVQRGFCAR